MGGATTAPSHAAAAHADSSPLEGLSLPVKNNAILAEMEGILEDFRKQVDQHIGAQQQQH